MIITKKLQGVLTIAADDTARPALNAVLIKDGQAVGTDGYMLMIVKLPASVKSEELPQITGSMYKSIQEALIRKGDLKKILANIPRNAPLEQVFFSWTIDQTENGIEFVATDFEVINKIVVKNVDAEYPRFEKIIPNAEDTQAHATVSIDYLIKMLTAFKKTGIKNNFVTIELNTPLNPIVLRAKDLDNNEVYGLIMPVRTTG